MPSRERIATHAGVREWYLRRGRRLQSICVFFTKRVLQTNARLPPINRRAAVSRSPRTATTQSRHCTRIVFPLVRSSAAAERDDLRDVPYCTRLRLEKKHNQPS